MRTLCHYFGGGHRDYRRPRPWDLKLPQGAVPRFRFSQRTEPKPREVTGMDTRRELERLARWRSIFAGWQLGTRAADDPESQAVRHHREATILLRCELTALTGLLIRKGVFTAEELSQAIGEEAIQLSKDYEKRFPGARPTDEGMEIDIETFKETTKGWRL